MLGEKFINGPPESGAHGLRLFRHDSDASEAWREFFSHRARLEGVLPKSKWSADSHVRAGACHPKRGQFGDVDERADSAVRAPMVWAARP
jgi:hypothetical protein